MLSDIEMIIMENAITSDLYTDPSSPANVSENHDVLIVGPGAIDIDLNGYKGPVPMDANLIYFAQYVEEQGSLTALDKPDTESNHLRWDGGMSDLKGVINYLGYLRNKGFELIDVNPIERDLIAETGSYSIGGSNNDRFDRLIEHGTWRWISPVSQQLDIVKERFKMLARSYFNLLKDHGNAIIHFNSKELTETDDGYLEGLIGAMQAQFTSVDCFLVNEGYHIKNGDLAAEYMQAFKREINGGHIITSLYGGGGLLVVQK